METPEIIALADQDELDFLDSLGVEPTEQTDLDFRLDWLLERIAKREKQIAANDAVAGKRILQIEDWRQGENGKLQRSIDWFRSQMLALLPPDAESFEKTYGQRSRRLPYGTIGYRKRPVHVEVFDEEKALAWARAHNLEIKVKESVSKTELRKAVESGEQGDGFELIREPDEFYVKVEAA